MEDIRIIMQSAENAISEHVKVLLEDEKHKRFKAEHEAMNHLQKARELLKELDKQKADNERLELALSNINGQYNKVYDDYKALNKNYKALNEEYQAFKDNVVMTKDQINREGRPTVLTEDKVALIEKERAEGKSLRNISDQIGVSHSTVARVVKDINSKDSKSFNK